MPIYYIVCEMKPAYPGMWTVWYIIKVIECDIEDYRKLYEQEVAPLLQNGRNIQGMMFHREPANPFREQGKTA